MFLFLFLEDELEVVDEAVECFLSRGFLEATAGLEIELNGMRHIMIGLPSSLLRIGVSSSTCFTTTWTPALPEAAAVVFLTRKIFVMASRFFATSGCVVVGVIIFLRLVGDFFRP